MNGLSRAWFFLWPPMLVVALLLVGWQLLVLVMGIPPYMLPSPWQVGEALLEQPQRLLEASSRTAIAMLLGFLCSAIGGVVLGSCLTHSLCGPKVGGFQEPCALSFPWCLRCVSRLADLLC